MRRVTAGADDAVDIVAWSFPTRSTVGTPVSQSIETLATHAPLAHASSGAA